MGKRRGNIWGERMTKKCECLKHAVNYFTEMGWEIDSANKIGETIYICMKRELVKNDK